MAFRKGFEAKTSNPSASSEALSSIELESQARELLLKELTKGLRSRAQLEKLLRSNFFQDELIENLLRRFTEVGLIDDRAYAKALINTRRNLKRLAKPAIRRELLSAGISETDFEEHLATLDIDSEVELAQSLAEKRLRSIQSLSSETQLRRVSAYLARRGFSQGIVSEAIRKARQSISAG